VTQLCLLVLEFGFLSMKNESLSEAGSSGRRIGSPDRSAYFTVMVNVSVLLHPLALVYVATYESVPTVSGMLLI
jgi:hypothetical protein